ncbi:pyridoxal-dependent decarboxylase, partial [Acidocella sp. KAb 2-4]|uniref:pyridoxal phosphate-dependent decarboxylase family protein n=1 Tax=Acidocella sp. KAb 2-4 TaxID=2885158 RepID=UPI001D063DC1
MSDEADIPVESLFPAATERSRLAALLAAELEAAYATMGNGRVTPVEDRRRFATELSRFTFSSPVDLTELLPWLVRQMREGVVQMTHPRYFGLFNPAPGFPSILADHIAAAFNPQLAAAKTAPAATAIEAHVIAQIAHRAGLPAGSAGHFTNSGSEANFTAMTCALTKVCPSYRDTGARAFRTPPAIYISREAHLAWLKIAHQAGIGRLAIRLIDTDGHGRLSPIALAEAVRADTANGAVPVMIVATAGTTVGGMIDPLRASAEIAEQAGAWFHVDAAWGGAAIASDLLRPLLSGIDLADSVTIDAHKWFATTMGCGMFITARPWVLNEAFNIAASFMPTTQSTPDPYTASMLWSRRFLGLRLFLNLAAAGWAGYAHHVDRTVRLSRHLQVKLASCGWETVNPGGMGVLCVKPPAPHRPVREIADAIVSSGEAWIAAATFEGRDVIRICITN